MIRVLHRKKTNKHEISCNITFRTHLMLTKFTEISNDLSLFLICHYGYNYGNVSESTFTA